MFGGGDDESLACMGMMTPPILNPAISGEISPSAAMGREERIPSQPQWSHQETREFIAIRAELERDFSMSKRNKTLWEVVSAKMRERGFRRSPEQCKCKWKNLVNRYKGKETSDPDTGRQCPFFEELHAIFSQRAQNMQRLLESETHSAQVKKGVKRFSGDRSSEEFSEEEYEVEDESEEERPRRVNYKKRKAEKAVLDKSSRSLNVNSNSNVSGGIKEMLKEFFQQQQRMEMQWREIIERHIHERRLFELEWRQSMEKLERERLMVEQAWREREEQRRMREENRAERRDALLTTLLNKLIHESS